MKKKFFSFQLKSFYFSFNNFGGDGREKLIEIFAFNCYFKFLISFFFFLALQTNERGGSII